MRPPEAPRAEIARVEDASPAFIAGLRAGDVVISVDGHPIRDILDWQWFTAEDDCQVIVMTEDGGRRSVRLVRGEAQPWGVVFNGTIFDAVRTCRNACTFCFMRQLPPGLRPSLTLRDDDFRLSFLSGNFVTLTNLDEGDVNRVIEQRLSPLRVSLHAVRDEVRTALMGSHAACGLRNLRKLLDAGIEVDAQIVLVPGINDGAVLDETVAWAYGQEGITALAIVPLGYTRYQNMFTRSFNDAQAARAILDQLRPFQQRAQEERGCAWVYAADEFYLNAYGRDALRFIPAADFYDGFPLFEDGVGIVRSCVDEWNTALQQGDLSAFAQMLTSQGRRVVFICGMAMQAYFPDLLEDSPLRACAEALFVPNDFFGGNVNVTGLLAGQDMARSIQRHGGGSECWYLLPQVAFNEDGLTVDDMDERAIADKSGKPVRVVPSNPLDCIKQMMAKSKGI